MSTTSATIIAFGLVIVVLIGWAFIVAIRGAMATGDKLHKAIHRLPE